VQVACASAGSVCALENHVDAIASTQQIDKVTKIVSLITVMGLWDLDVVCIEPP
jgi:hypothetical protein